MDNAIVILIIEPLDNCFGDKGILILEDIPPDKKGMLLHGMMVIMCNH